MDSEDTRFLIIRDLIMDAIADDFESFDTISDSVCRWASEAMDVEPSSEEIESGLVHLLESGLADAYVLTNTNRKVPISEVSLKGVSDFYFYLSGKGLQALRQQG